MIRRVDKIGCNLRPRPRPHWAVNKLRADNLMIGYLHTRMSRIECATRYSGRVGNQGSVIQRSAPRPDTQTDHGAEGVASRGGRGRSSNR